MSTKQIIRRVLNDERSTEAFVRFVATVAAAALDDDDGATDSASLETIERASLQNTPRTRGPS